MTKFLIAITFGCLLFFQKTSGQNIKPQFAANERLTLKVSYNLGIIKIPAGELIFRSSLQPYNNRQVAYFEVIGNSYSAYDHIYKVRDQLKSYSEPDKLLPLWFEKQMDQNGQVSLERYVINHDRKQIYSFNSNMSESKFDTITFKNIFFDFITLAYYIRQLNFNSFKIGDKLPMNVICENKFYPINIIYMGIETISLLEKGNFRCLKLNISVISGSIFNEGETITAWVTNDENRLPIQMEAKILIGSVRAVLIKAENTRKPLMAKLK